MSDVNGAELIDLAAGVLKPHAVGRRLFGNVAATLVTADGRIYSGVCIDTGSGTVSVRNTPRSRRW